MTTQGDGPRLQRYLAEAGIAARRKAEVLITEGRVRVNGRVAELGSRVQPHDRVEVDGKLIVVERKRYILLNKPRGCVSTLSDPEGRPTVMDLLPSDGPRIYPVGRLDFNTEGLLLFTNDGDLANGLMHPRRSVPKTYHAKLRSLLSDGDVAQLEEGIELDGAVRKATVVGGGTSESGKHSWVELTITEGRNRQVHRMMEYLGHEIVRLIRVGYGPLDDAGLARARWRPLEPSELAELRDLAGTERPRGEKVERVQVPRKPSTRSSEHGNSRPGRLPSSRPGQRASGRPSDRSGDRDRSKQPLARPSYGLDRKGTGRSKPPGAGRSFSSDRKPAGEGRSFGSDRKPGGAGRAFSSDRKPGGSDRKPGGSDRKPGGGDRKPFAGRSFPPPAGRAVTTDRKAPHAHGDKKPARRR